MHPEGYYEISNVISDWLRQVNPRMVVNIDGFPVEPIGNGPRIAGREMRIMVPFIEAIRTPIVVVERATHVYFTMILNQ